MMEEQKVEETVEAPVVEEVSAKEQEPAPKKTAKKVAAAPATVWFESREKEPSMFVVAGINPIRNFSTGRLEWEVAADDVDRFVQNHFVMNARVVRKG